MRFFNQFEIEVTMKESSRNCVGILPQNLFEISTADQEMIDVLIEKSPWKDKDMIIKVALISMVANLAKDVVQLTDSDMKRVDAIMKKDKMCLTVRSVISRSILQYNFNLEKIEYENKVKLEKAKAKRLKKK
jgi:hypothetical protein